MRIILVILFMAMVVGTACSNTERPEVEPSPAPDELHTIIERIEALETVAVAPSPAPDELNAIIQRIEALETATELPSPTPLPTATETSRPIPTPTKTATPTPTPANTPTPMPVGRQDICYRALPVQEALLSTFSNTYLCAAIQVRELFRLTELSVSARGHLLKRTDFTDMPNLKELSVVMDMDGLAPDVFHSLSGLEYLHLTLDNVNSNRKTFPADLLNGLPSGLNRLTLTIRPSSVSDWNENQAIEMPSELFASVPRIKHLEIYLYNNGRGPHLQFNPRTLAGLSQLESLYLRGPLAAIPREMFADLESLEDLQLAYSVNRDPHVLYFPTLEMALKFSKYCGRNSDICVVGGTIEQ